MKDGEGDADLTPALLLHAYSVGLFPMAEHKDADELFWVDPRFRGVMPLDGFHISRSLARHLRRPGLRATLNTAFEPVLRACADRAESWINAEIHDLYCQLHAMGHAHSFEIWDEFGLAGGMYGVALGGAFFGESMFSARTNGSKTALACAVAHLNACGFALFDVQFITAHLESLGAVEIPRAVYHQRLSEALNLHARIDAAPLVQPSDAVVQRITQTS